MNLNLEQIVVEEQECTLIMVRRELTVTKTVFAGVILEILSARFKASMVVFNTEMTSSRPLGCWGLAFMVET